METMFEKVHSAIKEMSAEDAINLWNEYCAEANYNEDEIHHMDDFDEVLSGYSPWEVARAAFYGGDFCPAHDWFWFNAYGNLQSTDWPNDDENSPFDAEVLADWIVENGNALGNDEIQEVLDGNEEE